MGLGAGLTGHLSQICLSPDLTEDGGLVTFCLTHLGWAQDWMHSRCSAHQAKRTLVWPNHIPPGREMPAQSFPFLLLPVREFLMGRN